MYLKLNILIAGIFLMCASAFAQGPETVVGSIPVETVTTTPAINGSANGNVNGSVNGSINGHAHEAAQDNLIRVRNVTQLHAIESHMGYLMYHQLMSFYSNQGYDFGWFDAARSVLLRDTVIQDIQSYHERLTYLQENRFSLKATEVKPLQDELMRLNERMIRYIQILPEQLVSQIDQKVFNFKLQSDVKFTLTPAEYEKICKQIEALKALYVDQIPAENFGRTAYRRMGLLTKLQFLNLLQEVVVKNGLHLQEVAYILKDLAEGKNGFETFNSKVAVKLHFRDAGVDVLTFYQSEVRGVINAINQGLDLKLPTFERPIVKPQERVRGKFSKPAPVDGNDVIYTDAALDAEMVRRIARVRAVVRCY